MRTVDARVANIEILYVGLQRKYTLLNRRPEKKKVAEMNARQTSFCLSSPH